MNSTSLEKSTGYYHAKLDEALSDYVYWAFKNGYKKRDMIKEIDAVISMYYNQNKKVIKLKSKLSTFDWIYIFFHRSICKACKYAWENFR